LEVPLNAPAPERLALIVKSDGFGDLLLAISFAGIAASSGMDAVMFFTNRAARLLKRGGMDEFKAADDIDQEFIEGSHQMGFRDLGAMLRDVKATGHVRVYLCSRGAKVWDIDPDSMITEVDSVMGTATFLLEEARRARTVLTI
jgi:peroxiredoxin family protein